MRMAAARLLLLTLGAAAAALNPLFSRFEPIARPALEKFVAENIPDAPVLWCGEAVGCRLQGTFWQWLNSAAPGSYSVLALPTLEPRQIRQLAELQEFLPSQRHLLAPLNEEAPVPGLVLAVEPTPPEEPVALDVLPAPASVDARAAAWVDRTLSPSGLKFCPYTQSARISGSGLEGYGVEPAPILYAQCTESSLPALLTTFWQSCTEMLDNGESGTSSILLSAPRWDDRWTAWHREVFPLLEASVLSAGLGRELGIVCFHPEYSTPDDEWLVRHRFGHMHAVTKLRAWAEQQKDAELANASDDELAWAGSYQRRSPHAMINVLWARQLEQAEQKRKSAVLYTRNMRRALAEGREALDAASARERTL